MKKITYFYLANCPYCRKANELINELMCIDKYKDIVIERFEEKDNKEIADKYDYFYVPCFYIDNDKQFEGAVKKDDIQRVFDKVLAL